MSIPVWHAIRCGLYCPPPQDACPLPPHHDPGSAPSSHVDMDNNWRRFPPRVLLLLEMSRHPKEDLRCWRLEKWRNRFEATVMRSIVHCPCGYPSPLSPPQPRCDSLCRGSCTIIRTTGVPFLFVILEPRSYYKVNIMLSLP